jgi:hypothetical protein
MLARGLGAILLAVRAAGGQSAAEERLAAIRRLDSALVVRSAAYQAAEEGYYGRIAWVDVREGGMQVRTTGALESRVRAAARAATTALEDRGGSALRARLARRLPTIATDSAAALLGTEWRVWVTPDTGRGMRAARRYATVGRARTGTIAQHLIALAENLALEDADSALTAWLMGARLPLTESPRAQWSDAYVELSATHSSAGRRCAGGDVEACLTSLGLFEGPADRLDAWYPPEDHRGLIVAARVSWPDSTTRALAARCRKSGDAGACAAAARAIPPDRVPLPVSASARQLFVDEVFRSGGPDAYARLIAARGPLRGRFAAAAGVPVDVVAARWRERVLDARPETMRVTPALLLAVVGWCGMFGALGVARRSL